MAVKAGLPNVEPKYCFNGFKPPAWLQISTCKVTPLNVKSTEMLENCNLQFLVNYMNYYTFRNYCYKSLIYKGF